MALTQQRSGGPAASRDGSYDLAPNGLEKAWATQAMRATGADKRLDRTLRQMTNGEFTPGELSALKARSLDKIDLPEALKLQGIAEGPPVGPRPQQKAVIDRALAQKARDAYGRAVGAGFVRVR